MKKRISVLIIFILFLDVSFLYGQNRHRVIISSNPRGAEVLVKGKQVGFTPFGFWAPSGARFSLELQMAGYESWRSEFVANKDIVLDIPLKALEGLDAENVPQAIQHPVVLNSLPDGANVWINGEMKGKTPFRLPVTEGTDLNIILTMDGYEEWIRNVTVTGGIRETVQLQQIKKTNMKYWLIPGFALASYGLIQYFRAEDEPGSTETSNVWPSPPSRP